MVIGFGLWFLRGLTLASTVGNHIYKSNVHLRSAVSLAQSCSGNLLFTGGEEVAIRMFELGSHTSDDEIRMTANWNSRAGLAFSLAFEFPCLVYSSSDGRLSLIHVRKLLQCSRANQSITCTVEPLQIMVHGSGGNLLSVAVGADRIVHGVHKRHG